MSIEAFTYLTVRTPALIDSGSGFEPDDTAYYLSVVPPTFDNGVYFKFGRNLVGDSGDITDIITTDTEYGNNFGSEIDVSITDADIWARGRVFESPGDIEGFPLLINFIGGNPAGHPAALSGVVQSPAPTATPTAGSYQVQWIKQVGVHGYKIYRASDAPINRGVCLDVVLNDVPGNIITWVDFNDTDLRDRRYFVTSFTSNGLESEETWAIDGSLLSSGYEWREYDIGDTPPPWLLTTTLDDNAPGDVATNASGFDITPTLHDNDWITLDSDPFIHIEEARVTFNTPASIGSVTFTQSSGGSHSVTYIKTYEVYGTRVGQVEALFATGTPSLTNTVDILDGSYEQLRVKIIFEKVDSATPLESMNIMDFRWSLPSIPVEETAAGYLWRKRTRTGPSFAEDWGPYMPTTTLDDGAISDHLTNANGTSADDHDYSFASPVDVIIDVEALMFLDTPMSIQSVIFSAMASFVPIFIPPNGSYDLDVFAGGSWNDVATGTLPQGSWTDTGWDIDADLIVSIVRIVITNHRTAL